ncbi:DNA repair protein RecO [Patescibacteria group bacterium]|nr:MAG: DNA repair protein RecO [Patescibacteria group bacterium]
MALTFRANAIPLAKRPVRETDRVYSVLTEDRGKLELLARGSRKIVSKLAGEMEQIGVLDIFIARGRAFDHLAGAAALKSFPLIRASLPRLLAALAAAAFLDRAVKPAFGDPALFNLLREYLETVASAPERSVPDSALTPAFFWKLFVRLGFRPDLEKCVRCRKDVAGGECSWTSHHGGVVCRSCRAELALADAAPISRDTLTALNFFISSPLEECSRFFPSPPLSLSVKALTAAWSQRHLELPAIGV